MVFACALAGCQTTNTHQPPKKAAPEVFEGKVKRIYKAQDGAYVFRSYVIEWQGADVVVEDIPRYQSEPEKKVGDPIRVLVTRWSDSKDSGFEGVLNFVCVEARPNNIK